MFRNFGHLAIFHGDYSGIVEALITRGKYDAVFHGHTYKGKTLSLNPGSLMKETSSTIKGASVAIYDTKAHLSHILL